MLSDTTCFAHSSKETWSTSRAPITRRPIKERAGLATGQPRLTFGGRSRLDSENNNGARPSGTAVRGRKLPVLGEAVTRGRATRVGNAVIEALLGENSSAPAVQIPNCSGASWGIEMAGRSLPPRRRRTAPTSSECLFASGSIAGSRRPVSEACFAGAARAANFTTGACVWLSGL